MLWMLSKDALSNLAQFSALLHTAHQSQTNLLLIIVRRSADRHGENVEITMTIKMTTTTSKRNSFRSFSSSSSFWLFLFSFLFLAVTPISSSSSSNQQQEQQEQKEHQHVCHEEGVCFINDEDAKLYYFHGQKISIGFGEDQQVAGESWDKTLDVIAKTKKYISQVVNVDETFADVRKECKCRHELCSFWAAIGECQNNPDYMLLHCAPSCQTCDQLRFETRCPFDKNAPTVWTNPGDLNRMFERITTEEYYITKYQPTILSQPPNKPWVVVLDNVVSPEQCQRLIQLGANRGYERSKDVGNVKFDGTFDGVESFSRTSSNAWCLEECYTDPMTQQVLQVIENITGIPDSHSEYLQLLKYEAGQYYREHHDYIPFHNDRPQGVRILTVFLYLNDVEEGGGTHFSDLKLTVQPKQGRVVVWPSVLDHKPNRKDSMTHHEALPVIKGVKYGANAWVHQRDFKTPFQEKCT